MDARPDVVPRIRSSVVANRPQEKFVSVRWALIDRCVVAIETALQFD